RPRDRRRRSPSRAAPRVQSGGGGLRGIPAKHQGRADGPVLMRRVLAAVVVAAAAARADAQDASLEYQVKAAYLYNFVKFIEWPAVPRSGALTICTAGGNPFGAALDDIVRGESIDGRAIATR